MTGANSSGTTTPATAVDPEDMTTEGEPTAASAEAPAAAPAGSDSRLTSAEQALLEQTYPWSGPARRADWICLALMSASGFYALASTPLKALLIGSNPVLLELLVGSNAAIVAAAGFAEVGRVWLPIVVVAGVIGKLWRDPLWWWAGKLWGPRAMDFLSGRSPRAARVVAVIERFVGRHTWLALVVGSVPFIPSGLLYAMVGWSGMRLRTFLLVQGAVCAFWVGLWVWLGLALGQTAVDLAEWIGRYSLIIAGVLVVLIVVRQVVATRRAVAATRDQT